MLYMQEELPRRIAKLAVERGLIDIELVWDAARQYEKCKGNVQIEELFGLRKDQLEELASQKVPSIDEARSDTIAASLDQIEHNMAEPKTLLFEKITPDPSQYKNPSQNPLASRIKRTTPGPFSTGGPKKSSKASTSQRSIEERKSKILQQTSQSEQERYILGEEIGKGGVGRVVSTLDQKIGRTVALKTLKRGMKVDVSTLERFLTEARITAQLEHPSVIPIYDLSNLPNGQPFYTMRVVKHRSLNDVLHDPEIRKTFSLAKLCAIFVQVCRGIAYAHACGVIHRDLKPDNILLGDYGEVYVADWGIAKILGTNDMELVPNAINNSLTRAGTQIGALLGTPGYMSPEQAKGEWKTVSKQSDLFSLGIILYEILTHKRPFTGSSVFMVLRETLETEPVRPRKLFPECPLVLEDLCLSLLAKNPEDRPESAEYVTDEVEAFLEGFRERERREQEAIRLLEEAKKTLTHYQKLGEIHDKLLNEAKLLLKDVRPWEPVSKKRPAWKLEDQAKETDSEQAKTLAELIEYYSQALGYDPQCKEARTGLAKLYFSKAQEAEELRQEPSRIFYESLVHDYDDGRYTRVLQTEATLSLQTNPPGVEVVLCRYTSQDRVLVPVEEKILGNTPLEGVTIAHGTYLLRLRHPSFREVKYPVFLRREEHHQAEVNLYTENEIGREFCYIPGGNFLMGGDEHAFDSGPRQEVFVKDFALAKFPVTFDEYLAYINDLSKNSPKRVAKYLPRGDSGDGLYVKQDKNGRWVPDYERLIGKEAKEFCREEEASLLPIFGIDWFDALAYCRWRSERDRVMYRLPKEIEWEKAARGVDGRFYPWGDRFDPSFCKMRHSRSGVAYPEPIGTFRVDKSPYGVRDLAGGVREWIADIYGEFNSLEAIQQANPKSMEARSEASMRIMRGGAWNNPGYRCRTSCRFRNFINSRFSNIGLRLAKSLPKRRKLKRSS